MPLDLTPEEIKRIKENSRKAAQAEKETEESRNSDETGFLEEYLMPVARTLAQGAGNAAHIATGGALNLGDETTRAYTAGAGDAAFGLGGALDRYGGAAGDYLEGLLSGDEGVSFEDALERRTAARQQLAEDNPAAYVAGNIATAIPMGAQVGTLMARAAPNLAKSLWARLAGAGGFGATEGVTSQAVGQGNTENLDTAAALGAAGGLIGQAGGEILERVGRPLLQQFGIATRQPFAEAADELMEPGRAMTQAATGGKGLTEQQLREAAAQATEGKWQGSSRMVTDAVPELRREVANLTGNRAVTTRAKDMIAPMRARQAKLANDANDLVLSTFADKGKGQTRAAAAKATQAKLDQARSMYNDIFETPAAATDPIASKRKIKAHISENIFEPTDPSKAQDAYRLIEKEIDSIQAGEPNLSAKGMLNLKKALDDYISSMSNSTEAVSQLTVGKLIKAKNAINDFMKSPDGIPGYDKASGIYADATAAANMRQRAVDMMTKNKFDASMVGDYYKSLDVGEQVEFRKGVVHYLQDRTARGSENALRRLTAAKGSPEAKKLRAVFGIRTANLAREGNKMLDELADVKRIESKARTANPRPEQEQSWVPAAADLGAILFKTAQGQPASVASIASARRLASGMGGADATTNVLYNFLTQSDPKQAQAILEEMLRARAAPAASMLGAGVGTGAASGVTTIMD